MGSENKVVRSRANIGRLAFGMLTIMIMMVVCVLVQMAIRALFVGIYAMDGTIVANADRIPLMLWNAFRFDMQVAAYASLPMVLVYIVAVWVKGAWLKRFAWIYTTVIATALIVLGFSDIVFYNNFGCHFNNVTFDFFDEDPTALARGVWNETPIVTMVFATLIFACLIYYCLGKLYRGVSCGKTEVKSEEEQEEKSGRSGLGKGVKWTVIVVATIILVLSIRGSISTFPLRAEDIYVSSSVKMNDCVPNAAFMMKKAWSEKSKQFKVETQDETLSNEGFGNINEAKSVWLDIPIDSAKRVTIEDALYAKTDTAPKCKDMNVVLILTESWSGRLIDYEAMFGMDLLGEMRKHLGEDLLFRQFLSAANSTIDAVEHFTVNSPYPHLFASSYRDIEYPTAAAKLFRDNGYETMFVTGIELSWRNLMEVLPHQGFDKVIGKYEMLSEKPDAECNETWGVYDHSMLSYVNEILSGSGDKPKFVMCLTSTSHTPFEFPKGYPFADIDISDKNRKAFAVDDGVAMEYLRGYQYESNELGRFMSRLKESEVGRNTIVAITGDHNIRMILPYGSENGGENVNDLWWKYAVPLYMYLPEGVDVKVDESRRGSHSDIVPTLANLVLSDATYFKTGQNLLADSLEETIGINTEYVISSGDEMAAKKKAAALRALKRIYFQRLFAEAKSASK
ncbi:MAG: LTA synthase family protein [Bacteroidales bacterium]|nr:LTA synthase family protein [Bacteroidales bacterium]